MSLDKLKPIEDREVQKKISETMEMNDKMVNGLNKMVKPGEKYSMYKYEDPNNRDVKYNVGIQRLHDGFTVILVDPKDREKILKGTFKPNEEPKFSQILAENKEGVTKKLGDKKMPSNPNVAEKFMAIVKNVSKIDLTKKQEN